MTINKTQEGSPVKYAIAGRLDTTTAPEVETIINEELEGVTELVFDFHDLDYISSAGLRVLLSAQKKMNTKGLMKVINCNEIINEIFDITGFSDILNIE